jgi:hypothetical protein
MFRRGRPIDDQLLDTSALRPFYRRIPLRYANSIQFFPRYSLSLSNSSLDVISLFQLGLGRHSLDKWCSPSIISFASYYPDYQGRSVSGQTPGLTYTRRLR